MPGTRERASQTVRAPRGQQVVARKDAGHPGDIVGVHAGLGGQLGLAIEDPEQVPELRVLRVLGSDGPGGKELQDEGEGKLSTGPPGLAAGP
jgi:hypothetical protein